METLKITFYGKEAELFEAMINEPVGIYPIEYIKEYQEGTAEGYSFTIKSEKGSQFFFIGQEWAKRMMIYHCQHYSFGLEEDDRHPE